MANFYELDDDVDCGATERGGDTTALDAVAPLVDDAVHDLRHVEGGFTAEVMDPVTGEKNEWR